MFLTEPRDIRTEAIDRYGYKMDVSASWLQRSYRPEVSVSVWGPRNGFKGLFCFELEEARHLRNKLDAAIRTAEDLKLEAHRQPRGEYTTAELLDWTS